MRKITFKNTHALILSLTFLALSPLSQANALSPRGTGIAAGTMAIIFEDSATLLEKIPSALKLDKKLITPDNKYPVAMFLGKQFNLQSHMADASLLVEKQYGEATYSFTVIGPDSKYYTYTSNLIVDSTPSLLMGWALGYPKKMRSIQVTDTVFLSKSGSRLSLKAQYEDIQNYDQTQFAKNFEFLLSNIHRSISRTVLGYQCFDFKWSFDEKSLQPTQAHITLSEDFTKSPNKSHTVLGLDSSPFGAFKLRASWEISGVQKCDF